jgi:hypothetical protein
MQPSDPVLAASAILPAGEADEPLESWKGDEAFAAFLKQESEASGRLIKSAGIKVE